MSTTTQIPKVQFTNRRRFRKRKPVNKDVVRFVKSQIHKNIEDKFSPLELPAVFTAVSTTWVETDLCSLSQGVGRGNRVGNSVKITSLEVEALLIGADDYNVMRVIIALWTGASGTTPLNGLGYVAPEYGMNSPYKTYYGTQSKMLRKLYDNYIVIDKDNAIVAPLTYYKKFKRPIHIQYGDNTSTYPSARLMMAILSDSGAVSHPYVLNGYSMVRFEDA